MIRIAIVEDESIYVEQLQEYLKKYQEETRETVEVTVFSDGDEIVEKYSARFDIILLDIQMKFMDGMAAAEHIRKLDSEVILIFITNMAQYAIRGYAVNAFDFILKPVTGFIFIEKLKKAVAQVRQKKTKFLTVKIGSGVAKIEISQILFLESIKQRVAIHTNEEEYLTISTIKGMEEQLQGEHFFRCNSGYLVNLAAVRRVVGNEVIVGEHTLQISRPRRKQFMAALTDYMGGIIL